jgi:hypothetical protein
LIADQLTSPTLSQSVKGSQEPILCPIGAP